jgi:hypothetical protein
MAILAIVSIGVVSAYENNGVEFEIPDGYSPSGSFEVTTELGIEEGTCDFFKKGDDQIAISAITLQPGTDKEDYKNSFPDGFKEKTIAKKEGFLKDMGVKVIFNYMEDGKDVTIIAPDEDTVESIIPEVK